MQAYARGQDLAVQGEFEAALTAYGEAVEAEHAGLAPDMCAYHRAVTGAAVAGMMPVPESCQKRAKPWVISSRSLMP